MAEELEDIVGSIRACIQSNKGPTLVRNLSRDYETLVGEQIPFRKFKFANLEEFLRTLPTLYIQGYGATATVEAVSRKDSSHVTALIAKQKSSKK